MKREIIIHSAINEVRVAILEDGELAEFFIEMPNKERVIGNIYYGRVNKVVPALNAAFIDIGMKQDAFLHFSDAEDSLEKTVITEEEDSEELTKQIPDESEKKKIKGKSRSQKSKKQETHSEESNKAGDNLAIFTTRRSGEVKINLVEGKSVVVQITREAYHNKGVKVTSKIAIPGRYLVLMPYEKMIGVSRKIASYQERKRLRSLVKNFLGSEYGCIIRTASVDKTEEELKRDWLELKEMWSEIDTKIKQSTLSSLIYQDMQMATSIVRDLFTSNVQRVVVDSKKLFKEITSYIKKVSPHLENRVELYEGNTGIFEEFNIEKELLRSYKRKVNLHGGGDIVIEQTEAMTVIDVNSGRAFEKDQEKNSFKTNIEACRIIARQIRLRDLGGMIVIDFIDMGDDNNRKKLVNEMKKELTRDRAKTIVYPLTQLGLMQITRQRINLNIVEKITEICPTCKGIGRITSKTVLVNEIERWLRNFRKKSNEFRIILQLHPSIAEYITDGTISIVSKFMIKYFLKIKVQQNENVPSDQFKFLSVRQNKDITNDF